VKMSLDEASPTYVEDDEYEASPTYVEDDEYKKWFEQNTQDQIKCPDPQLITFPHRKKPTQHRPVSGMQFTFDAKRNAEEIRSYFGNLLDDKVSASKPNCDINFFWAIGEDTPDGRRYRRLTLTNSIHVGGQLNPEGFPEFECAIGYQPKSSKTVVMLKMSSKDSKEARKIIGRDKIWVYVFVAKKEESPIINCMILTRQREQTDNRLDRLDALKASLRKQLIQALKGLEGHSQKEAQETFEELFRADDAERLGVVNLPAGLKSMAPLVDAFRFVSTAVMERDQVSEHDEARPHRPVSVDTLVTPSLDGFTQYSKLIHDNEKTEEILRKTETREMEIRESLMALVKASREETQDYEKKLDNAKEATKKKYPNVLPSSIEFLLSRDLKASKEKHQQTLDSILRGLRGVRNDIEDVQSQISRENEVLTKLQPQLRRLHDGHKNMLEGWKNWQDKIRSLIRKKAPLTGSVEPKLQQADLFVKDLSEALILIDDEEKILNEQIDKLVVRANRLKRTLHHVQKEIERSSAFKITN